MIQKTLSLPFFRYNLAVVNTPVLQYELYARKTAPILQVVYAYPLYIHHI